MTFYKASSVLSKHFDDPQCDPKLQEPSKGLPNIRKLPVILTFYD